ncbi:GDP-mannose 6-dehydrogenase [Clostridium acidisoli DSM 12555]|uniref:UDP-glucose 6-dehydrogenase n=1 Tax=Clostridium acidisoli DSM 12555 TaxID=1121291 RepID=A0A1W1X362_9CLOT|nr:nucleotide sugar dehydrogenase [Clostridium acidisoli]SMC18335.1 GDP-mannose 6-dehydrogenase [Clostridium acidisoli DSM 12555]
MNVSIFGLGYVGCVSAGCFANFGNYVVGVDVNDTKVNLINSGKATIIEKDIDVLIDKAHKNGRLKATKDVKEAVLSTDVSIICVGTPSSKTGDLNLKYLHNVVKDIGEALSEKDSFHVIAIRSTSIPGTSSKCEKIVEDVSGKKKNVDFAFVSNPEFLREGTAVYDYENPSFILMGSNSERALDILSELYKDVNAPIIRTVLSTAEIMKYVNNTFHALKITFANEVGNICKNLGIDSHSVMNILCKDKKLNLSSYYLKPGFAYGGSCLPKDLKALNTLAKHMNVNVPLLSVIEESNENQKKNVLEKIISKNKKKIGILGLSFKAGTDDLRESPIVDIVEALIGKGYEISIYDKNVYLSDLTGTNKEYIETKIAHLQKLITNNIWEVIEKSEVIVVTNNEEEIKQALINKTLHEDNPAFNEEIAATFESTRLMKKIVIDLVRIDGIKGNVGEYDGLCW